MQGADGEFMGDIKMGGHLGARSPNEGTPRLRWEAKRGSQH